jgi:hypothetical protein
MFKRIQTQTTQGVLMKKILATALLLISTLTFGAPAEIVHGEVGYSDINGKTTGQYINLATLPADARVIRITIIQKEGWTNGSLVFEGKLVNSQSDTAFDRAGISTAAYVSPNLGTTMASVLNFRKETSSTTIKIKLLDDVAGVDSGDVLEYFIEYVQE